MLYSLLYFKLLSSNAYFSKFLYFTSTWKWPWMGQNVIPLYNYFLIQNWYQRNFLFWLKLKKNIDHQFLSAVMNFSNKESFLSSWIWPQRTLNRWSGFTSWSHVTGCDSSSHFFPFITQTCLYSVMLVISLFEPTLHASLYTSGLNSSSVYIHYYIFLFFLIDSK